MFSLFASSFSSSEKCSDSSSSCCSSLAGALESFSSSGNDFSDIAGLGLELLIDRCIPSPVVAGDVNATCLPYILIISASCLGLMGIYLDGIFSGVSLERYLFGHLVWVHKFQCCVSALK